MKKILTVVGARPQFIKAAIVSKCFTEDFSKEIEEIIVHTGQHFDSNMSDIFFDELGIPRPKYNLNISGGNHGAMTGKMLEGLEEIMIQEKPDVVLIYGDTNSTLASAIAAVKLHIPIAHVESGLRSFNMKMPEEVNRILSDRISKYLFCPTDAAVDNLKKENITNGVYNVGDVMFDAALYFGEKADKKSNILNTLSLKAKDYVLVTCHRAENTNDESRLRNIFEALNEIAKNKIVVLPMHPRTLSYLEKYDMKNMLDNIKTTEPLSYLDMVALEKNAHLILTDSGGVQKEAFFHKVPCITMRDETEWVETVESKWNRIAGTDKKNIIGYTNDLITGQADFFPYGNGDACNKIGKILIGNYK